MSKKQRLKDREAREQIAQSVTRRLVLSIAFLIAVLLGLMFKVGQVMWPAWLVLRRMQIEGIVVLAIILVILLSPTIIESSSNPRALSGPGKNPEGPRLE